MRIIEVVGALQIGGAENQVVQLLNGLDRAGHECHLVLFQSNETHLFRALEKGINIHQVSLVRWGQINCIRRLIHLFRKIQPQVVQSHMFHTNLYVVIAAWLARIPVIITTEHGKNLWKNYIHHLIERWIISPLATMRIAVSRDIRDIRVHTSDIPADKVMIIPPCVEIPPRQVEYHDKPSVMLGAVGRMVDAKDYPTLLRAFSRVVNSGVQADLVFLGDGPGRSLLETLARDLGIIESVQFPGFQSNIDEWLRRFDIVVFSSIREGIPVAMLEAMAVGVPMVATRVGGIPEVIRDGFNGLLVDCGRPEELANAIMRLAQDVELRKSLGREGRNTVVSLYSREAICGCYEKLFAKLASKRGVNAG